MKIYIATENGGVSFYSFIGEDDVAKAGTGLGVDERIVCVYEEAPEALKALLDFVVATDNRKLRNALEQVFGAMYNFGKEASCELAPSE